MLTNVTRESRLHPYILRPLDKPAPSMPRGSRQALRQAQGKQALGLSSGRRLRTRNRDSGSGQATPSFLASLRSAKRALRRLPTGVPPARRQGQASGLEPFYKIKKPLEIQQLLIILFTFSFLLFPCHFVPRAGLPACLSRQTVFKKNFWVSVPRAGLEPARTVMRFKGF